MESDTPIGFLQGAGGISEQINDIMELAHPLRPGAVVLFDTSPQDLVRNLTKAIDRELGSLKSLY
jgi:hypothetical protein